MAAAGGFSCLIDTTLHDTQQPALKPSMCACAPAPAPAAAVLVFALLESKMSQPRNFLGGQMLSAVVGITTR